ncbi:hypothetical protein LCGC14_2025930 [marine sediment metagenome]|uniref:Uncharacterized protein n=1 Tax=marine sediment metagenome TaxID=412755 RepID=A0A0F9EWB7_9ZZZZ
MKSAYLIIGIAALAGPAAAGYVRWSGRSAMPGQPEQSRPQRPGRDPATVLPEPVPAAARDALKSKALVTKEAVEERKKMGRYIHDPKIAGGALRGICLIKYDKPVRLYPPLPIELEGGNAIAEPGPGEQAYYESRKPVPISYLGRYAAKEKRYGVQGAVIMIRNVQAGRRGDFDRIRYQVDFRNQHIVPAKPQGGRRFRRRRRRSWSWRRARTEDMNAPDPGRHKERD